MARSAVVLGLAAFGLAVLSFLVLGFGRLVLGYRTAAMLAAPFGLVALLLSIALAVGFALARVGIGPLAE